MSGRPFRMPGRPSRIPESGWSPSWMIRSHRENLPHVQKYLMNIQECSGNSLGCLGVVGVPPGCPGVVGRPSWMTGSF